MLSIAWMKTQPSFPAQKRTFFLSWGSLISRWRRTIDYLCDVLKEQRHSAVVCHIYSTPENGTLAFACFSLSFRSGQKNGKESFSLDSGGASGRLYYILFSCWRKGFSLSVHDNDVVVLSFVVLRWESQHSTVLRDSGLSTWTDCSRIRVRALLLLLLSSFLFCREQEKIWRWLLEKKQQCPDFSYYKKQTGPTSTPNSWSGAPMSIGAISMIGRRDVFVVL